MWKKILAGEEVDFSRFAESQPPLEVLSAILAQIHGLYQDGIGAGRPVSEIASVVERLLPAAGLARRRSGPGQRDVDLHLMRVLRHSGQLCAVLGAGVTMAAGGPSWAELVRRLLAIGLGEGFEIVWTKPSEELRFTDMLPRSVEHGGGTIPDSPESAVKSFEDFVSKLPYETVPREGLSDSLGTTGIYRLDGKYATGVQGPTAHVKFSPPDEALARSIADAIDTKTSDIEMLMRGAELCYRTAGQHLFAAVTTILYEGGRSPSTTHQAIAELAEPQQCIGPGDRRGYGWSSLITYNYDDLMGEALDQRGIARASYAMRGQDVVGDPNAIAKGQGQNSPHLPILHLHGYIPRRFFYITHVKFVFATSQYATAYGADQRPLLDSVFKQFLATPGHRALYVGCSFEDNYMNDLLETSRRHLPGTEHWALLKWNGSKRYADSTPEEIERCSQRYVDFGVRPVWFDEHCEIPDLIRRLK